MWLQPKLLGRRCRGEMKNKRNYYPFPPWPQSSWQNTDPVQVLSQKIREVSPPETLLPSGELLVELGEVALLIHSYLHCSISCVSWWWCSNRSLKPGDP